MAKSLGQYDSAPVYQVNSDSLQLNYTNGDACGDGKHISSVINFYCKPGKIDFIPVYEKVVRWLCVLLCDVLGKQLWSCLEGQLT